MRNRRRTRRIRYAGTVAAALGAAVLAPAAPVGAGGGCHSPEITEGRGTTVELGKMCMTPTVLRTDAGATVTFVNRDPFEHNVMGVGFGAELPHTGDTWQYRFASDGTYPYACTLHPGMSGVIVVGNGTGTGPVVEVGPYHPPAPPVTSLVAVPAGEAEASDDGASVPLPVAVVGGVLIALVALLAGRSSRLGTTRFGTTR